MNSTELIAQAKKRYKEIDDGYRLQRLSGQAAWQCGYIEGWMDNPGKYPGCKMLSLGDSCDCKLCTLERERDTLQAENEQLKLAWQRVAQERDTAELRKSEREVALQAENKRLGHEIETALIYFDKDDWDQVYVILKAALSPAEGHEENADTQIKDPK